MTNIEFLILTLIILMLPASIVAGLLLLTWNLGKSKGDNKNNEKPKP